nr:uncharacterized protein LOC105333538 isoform X1 [Crassostrea gigas]
MKIPQVFCLVVLLFISVEVLGQRQKGSRNSGNNGIGNGPNQENGSGRKSGWRHSDRHAAEHGGERRHRNRGRKHSKHDHVTTPEPVLTEKDMVQFLCNQCKQKEPNNANCQNLCKASTTTDVNKTIAGQLGNPFCSFCEYYRSYPTYYQMCRNRMCAAGKK